MSTSRLLSLALLAAAASAACRDEPTAVRTLGPRTASSTQASLSDKEQLGKFIFFDTRLSGGSRPQACAGCHDPTVGWTGPESATNAHGAVYEGSVPGRFGNRKPPSSAYATLSPVLHLELDKNDELFVGGNFWDGRATGEYLGNPAADQAQGPFLNPVEQALASASDVVGLVCTGPYGGLFTQVWGASICSAGNVTNAYADVALSIAAFEASAESNAFSSKFDAYQAGLAKLTPDEHLGLALFRGKAKCGGCHVIDDGPKGEPLFTDFTYDNIGLPKNPENPWYGMTAFNPAGASWLDEGLGGFLASRQDYQAFAGENLGKQKVPTLRNVDLRPSPGFVKAYGHNGYFKSLASIVHFYNTRDVRPTCPGAYTEAQALAADCWPAPEIAANVNRSELGDLRLSAKEEQAIVSFLKTLSDGYVP